MLKISHMTRTDGGYHAVGHTIKGDKESVPILEARAAVVPPTGSEQGYFVIMGQELNAIPNGKRPLLFLSEGKSDNQRELLQKLSDDAGKLAVRVVYAVENTGFYELLWNAFKSVNEVSVRPAPFPDDVDFGLALVKEWLIDKAVKIPEAGHFQTEVRKNLELATESTTGFVIDALRYLIGGFVQFKPQRPVTRTQTKPTDFYYG